MQILKNVISQAKHLSVVHEVTKITLTSNLCTQVGCHSMDNIGRV